MATLKNPFVVYGYKGPEYFCDRMQETQKMISALENERNITLVSPRRMGKTGLIHHVFHTLGEQEPEVRCFYMDLLQTKNLEQMVQLFALNIIGQLDSPTQNVLRRISDVFSAWRPVLEFDPVSGYPSVSLDIRPHEGERTLKQIFEYMRLSDKRCYVAIDEFQQILNYENSNVEAMLRSYIQFLPNVYFIFAGSRQHVLEQMFTSVNRPFFQGAQLMTLRNIPEPTYYSFAQAFYEKQGRTLTEDVFSYIYNKVDGITWYIQALLNRMYENRDEEMGVALADAVLKDIVEEQSGVFSSYYQPLTDIQGQLIKAVAKEHLVKSPYAVDFLQRYGLGAPSSVRTALQSLIDKELIYPSPEGYVVYDRFFGEWLRNIPIR